MGPGQHTGNPFEGLTDEERRTTEEHLKALGYID